nr:unnamed protein product [Digitaria exilis]
MSQITASSTPKQSTFPGGAASHHPLVDDLRALGDGLAGVPRTVRATPLRPPASTALLTALRSHEDIPGWDHGSGGEWRRWGRRVAASSAPLRLLPGEVSEFRAQQNTLDSRLLPSRADSLCFRGDRAALTALRLRRVVSFLRRHRLYDTAHEYARSLASSPLSAAIALPVFDRSTPIPSTDAAVCRLERRTGAFFDAAHFRRLLGYFRWADASSYALGFPRGRRAHRPHPHLPTLGGRTYGVDALFQRIDAFLDSDGHHLRKVLLAIRSDRARCFSREGLHSTAHTYVHLPISLERNSLVYFDAAHLRKLVKDGRWEDAGDYMDRFEPLWEGEGTSQRHAAFMHILQHHAMLDYLACRGDDGGRTASSLFCKDNAAFREKFPEPLCFNAATYTPADNYLVICGSSAGTTTMVSQRVLAQPRRPVSNNVVGGHCSVLTLESSPVVSLCS